MNKPIIWQCMRFLFVVTVFLLTYVVLKYTINWFYPFLIAFIIASFIHPLVSLLETKAKFPRGLATFLVLTGLMMIVLFIIFMLVSEIIEGVIYLADILPLYFEKSVMLIQHFVSDQIIPFYRMVMSWIQTLDAYEQVAIEEHVQQLTNQLSAAGAVFLRDLLLMIPTIITAFPYSLAVIIVILIATFIITKDWTNLKNTLSHIMPRSVSRAGNQVTYHLERSVFGFFKAQVIIVTISTCIILLGLFILKIEHALTIALLIGFVDILPLIGTGLVFIPWIGYLFITNDYFLTIGLSIIYMVVVILRQFIEPKILSAHIGINPLLALIILFFSIQFWGIGGILFTPLLLILISALFQAGIPKKIIIFIKGND